MEATQELSTQTFGVEELNDGAYGELLPINSKYFIKRLINDETMLGRREDCDLIFEDPKVSGHHCKVVRRADPDGRGFSVFVEDLSSNGTYVNANKVGKKNRYLLADGDFLALLSPKITNNDNLIMFTYKDLTKPKVVEQQDEIFRHYEFVKELGKGAFSVVKLAMNKRTHEAVAVKEIEKKKVDQSKLVKQQLDREIDLLKALSHPNIVNYINVYHGKQHIYIVLELVTGGELFDRIRNGRIPEEEARTMFKEMLGAIKYLHDRDIVHRDLKPENVLMDEEGHIKIADFGLARVAAQNMMTTICGTPEYLAPEVFKASMKKSSYDKKVDMWSLGVVLYLMLTGELPLDDSQRMQILSRENGVYIVDKKFNFLSETARDLVSKLICVNPKKRYSVEEALEHPWITTGPSHDDNISSQPISKKRKRLASPDKPIAMIRLGRSAPLNAPTTSLSAASTELAVLAIDDAIHIWSNLDAPNSTESIRSFMFSLGEGDRTGGLARSSGSILRDEIYGDAESVTAPSPNLITRVACCDQLPKIFALGTVSSKVVIYQINSDGHVDQKQIYSEHSAAVRALAWNGKYLVTGGDDGSVFVHDVSSNNHLLHQFQLEDEVLHVGWFKPQSLVVAVGRQFTMAVWSLTQPSKPLFSTDKLQSLVTAMAVCPRDLELVALGFDDGMIEFWNIRKGERILSHKESGEITGISWISPDLVAITSGTEQTTVATYRLSFTKSVPSLEMRSTFVVACRVLAMSTTFRGENTVCICSDNRVRIWSLFGTPDPVEDLSPPASAPVTKAVEETQQSTRPTKRAKK